MVLSFTISMNKFGRTARSKKLFPYCGSFPISTIPYLFIRIIMMHAVTGKTQSFLLNRWRSPNWEKIPVVSLFVVCCCSLRCRQVIAGRLSNETSTEGWEGG